MTLESAVILGIDYGSKRIGVARAGSLMRIATPLEVIPNNEKLFDRLAELIAENRVDRVVVGNSTNLDGTPNTIASDISDFIEHLIEVTGVEVVREDEYYTTKQARRTLGEKSIVDASAASLILQSYLDRQS